MAYSIEQIKKYRTRFGWVFLVFFLILMVFSLFGYIYDHDIEMPKQPSSTITPLIVIVSLLTSVTSLLGFLFTTVVAWRKERREQQHSDLDLEKKRLEVERLRQELICGRNKDGQEG